MSNYSLLRESRVVVVYGGQGFEFDALSDITSSLAFEEYKSNRKTVHSKNNYPLSYVTRQSPTSVSMTINLSTTRLEGNFLMWMGMTKNNNTYSMPKVSPVEPRYIDIYIINKTATIKISKCFVSTVDFSMDKSVTVLNIACEGAKQELLTTAPTITTTKQGAILKNSPLNIKIGPNLIPAVGGVGVSMQQQCTWRDQHSVHDMGSIYNHSVAIVSEMNVSATMNVYFIRRTVSDTLVNVDVEYNVPITIYNKSLSLYIPSARIIKRLDVQDVYVVSYDIIPAETSDLVTLTLLGE